ncbi:hypothetical protein A0J61_05628 [Choanephora cucurbitarum]|uniref:Arrestin C-terminal-like domain-containing protein n=1 Tax=Choanephora cucurbitarum TaxID=101091 RepID=A0A1C7NBA7_9FUNG|nr:hypothetical protein A0J61_05628 [Choanephora cucurbitarum]
MPYVETSISKKLVCISSQPHTLPSSSTKNRIQPSFEVRLPSKDFPLGEVIPITLVLCHISNDSIDMVHARFYQIQTWHRSQAHTGQPKKEYRKFRHLISQNTKKITSDDHNNTNTLKIDLCLQDISLPTFTYGSVFSITYVLEVTVKQKGIWSRRLEVADIPIRLGTLGYCSKAPENMQVYSAFRGVFESSQDSQVALSVPRFVEVIEYEEALPLYVDERPPSYTSIAHSFLQNCVM